MTSTYELLREEGQLEADTTLLKSYVLETQFRAHTGAAFEQVSAVLNSAGAGRVDFVVEPTEDATLHDLTVRRRGAAFHAYLDTGNPRFWIFHTMGGSGSVDWAIERLSSGLEFDRMWLPADLLESLTGLGRFRGLGLSFDRRPFGVDEEADQQVAFLKMQLWGNRAAAILEVLRGQGAFPGQTTLSKVRLRYDLDDAHTEFTLDDIKYDGKVTARGTSFASHVALLERVVRPYQETIERIEGELPVRRRDDRMTGEPIFLRFEPRIEDLEGFCHKLFSGGWPFGLWGAPVRLRTNQYRVVAVDLHVGRPLTFEIYPQFMRVYLSDESCGNSVLRLYTNLQHHYDALVAAEKGDGERVLSF